MCQISVLIYDVYILFKTDFTPHSEHLLCLQGGYMAAKVSKLQEQFKLDAPKEKQKEGSSSNIFCGVSIYVNGYTGNCALCKVLLKNTCSELHRI